MPPPNKSSEFAFGILATAAAGTVLATAVGNAEGITDITSLTANLIQVGAPCAVGSAVAQLFPSRLDPTNPAGGLLEKPDFKRALLGGTATAAVLIGAGALPPQFDLQLASFVLLASAAVLFGDIALRWKYSSPQ